MATGSCDWRKWVGVAGLVCLSLTYFVAMGVANSDLSDGGYCLFMDEEVTFGGVQKIYNAPNNKKFKWQIVDGDDHRYGRIVWYTSALVSRVPERLYGEQGQIIATRMWYAAVLWAAYVVLALTFLPGWLFRNAALAAMILLPSTPYYASMPKPEPLQLLFLALFLRFGLPARFCFGWHWLFLGLAFGSKISTAPLVVPFFLAAFLAEIRVEHPTSSGLARLGDQRFWLGLLVTVASFMVGWGIAVPLLFQGTGGLRKWWTEILKNLGHSSDDEAVNAGTWLDAMYNKWIWAPSWLLVAVTALVSALAAWMSVRLARRRQFGPEYLGLVPWLAGLALLVPIMMRVNRLWLIYLHPSAVLFCVAAFALSDGFIRTYFQGWSRRVAQAQVLLVFLGVMYYQLPQSRHEVRQLATRTEKPQHQARAREYQALTALFADASDKLGRPIRVAYDPVLYLPAQSPKLELHRFYGGFFGWEHKLDMVIVDKTGWFSYWLPNSRVPAPGSASLENMEKGRKEYLKHVRGSGSGELVEPVYVAVEFPVENILVLVREDIVAGMHASVKREPSR